MDKNENTEDFDISLEKRFHKIKSLITKFLRHSEFDLKKPNIFTDNILKTLYFQNLCAGEIMNVLIENNLKKYCDVIKHLFLSQQIVMKNIVNTISQNLFNKENFPKNSNLFENPIEISNLKKKRKKIFQETMKKVNFKTKDKKDKLPIKRRDINNITYEIKEKTTEKIKNSISELDQKAFKALKLLNTGKELSKAQLEDPLLLLRVNKLLSNDIINSHLSKYEDIKSWMLNSSKILNNSRHFSDVKNQFGFILNDMGKYKDKNNFGIFENHNKIMKFSEFEEIVKDKIENGYYVLFDRIVNYLRKEKSKKEIGKSSQTEMTYVILDKQKMFLEQKNNKNVFLIENLNEQNQYFKDRIADLDFQVEEYKKQVKNLLEKNQNIHFQNEKLKNENFFQISNKSELKKEIKTIESDKLKLENKFKKSLQIISGFKKNLKKIFSKIKNHNLYFNEFQNEILGIDRILHDCTFSIENYCFDLIKKIKDNKIFFKNNNSNSFNNLEDINNKESNTAIIKKKLKNNLLDFSTKNTNNKKKRNSYSLFSQKDEKNISREKFNILENKNKEFNKTKNRFQKNSKKSLEIDFEIEKITKARTLYTKKFMNKSNSEKNNKSFLIKKNKKKPIKQNKNYKKHYYLKTTKKSNSMIIPKPKKRILRLSLFNVNNNMTFKEEDYNLNFKKEKILIEEKNLNQKDLKKINIGNFKDLDQNLKNSNIKIVLPNFKNNKEFSIKLENNLDNNFKNDKKIQYEKKNSFNNFKINHDNNENNILNKKKNKIHNFEINIIFICKTCANNTKTNKIMKFFKKGININKESEVIGKSFSHLETYNFYKKLKKIFEKKIINKNISKNNIIERKLDFSKLDDKNEEEEESKNLLFKKNLIKRNNTFLSKNKEEINQKVNSFSFFIKNKEEINQKVNSKIKNYSISQKNLKIMKREKIQIEKIINSQKNAEKLIPKQKKIKELINTDLNLKKTIISNLLKDMRINHYKTDISFQKNLYLMEINKMENSKEVDFGKSFKIEGNSNFEPINYFLKKIYMIIYSIKFKKISKSEIIDFQNKIILGSNSSLNVSGKKITTEFILFKICEFLDKFGNHFLKEDLKKKSEILIESFINFHKECKPNCGHLDLFYDYLKKYIDFILEKKNYPLSKIFFGGSIKN